ncbi:dynamin family protein [Streptomyces sp. NPDC058733]|uniref:dynamin family protein n=1 Tax=unclassified Streptomyces TaxID=2593676 RepID=UPI00365A9AA8
MSAAHALANEVYRLAREQRAAEVARRLLAAARLATGPARVIVVGPRSAGKSSLVNALLGREQLLPVDDDVASNVYVRVHAPDPGQSYEGATVHFAADRGGPREISLEELAEWAAESGNPDNDKRVAFVDVRVRHPLLASGLVLLDTPGAGGLVGAHAQAVLTAARDSDAMLVVVEHMAPLSDTVLSLAAGLGPRRALFAFNRTDQPGDTRRSIDDSRTGLARRAPDLSAGPFLPTSALLALDASDEPDPERAAVLHQDSGVGLLAGALRGVIVDVRRAQARQLLTEVAAAIRSLAAPAQAVLRAASSDPLAVQSALRKEIKRLESLRPSAQLARRVSREEIRLQRRLEGRLLDLRQDLDRSTHHHVARRALSSLPQRTEQAYGALWHETVQEAHHAVAAAVSSLSPTIVLPVPEAGLPGAIRHPELVRDSGRTGRISRLAAHLERLLISTIVIYRLPFAIVQTIGDMQQHRERLDRESARQYLGEVYDQAKQNLPHELSQQIAEMTEQGAELLRGERDERLQALRASVHASAAPGQSRSASAQRYLAELRRLHERVTELHATLGPQREPPQ